MFHELCCLIAVLGGKVVKNLPTKHETRVHSLSQEDPLEKEIANPSSVLAWEISWTEEPDRLQSMRSQRVILITTKCLLPSSYPYIFSMYT